MYATRYISGIIGIVLVLIGIYVASQSTFELVSKSTSFENEPVDISKFEDDVDSNIIPTKLIIPSLTIDLEIRPASIINGYWEVFDDYAGWGKGSGIPGASGNQVIFAHAREGLFKSLDKIEVGDLIYVHSVEYHDDGFIDRDWHAYSVMDIKEVFPNQLEVISPTVDEQLTLYTCSGYKDSRRLIVVALPVS